MSSHLLVVGAGGHGRVVADAASETRDWDDIAFADDAYPRMKRSGEWAVIGASTHLKALIEKYRHALVAIGRNDVRMLLLRQLEELDYQIVNIVHPRAILSKSVNVGKGSVVMAGAVINFGTILGNGVIVNTGATVDHDCAIGDGVHICPGSHLAGNVEVGDRAWIGLGASLKEGVAIGSDVMIGAGAVVIDDVQSGQTVVGVPARPIERTGIPK